VTKKSEIAKCELIPRFVQSNIVLCADLMYINGIGFLVTVSENIGLTMIQHVPNRTTASIKRALYSMIDEYKKQNFDVRVVKADGEGGIGALMSDLSTDKRIDLQIAAKNQHVPVVERKIRQIKERVRAHFSTLPFKLTAQILVCLVLFVVQSINWIPSKTRNDVFMSPKEIFSGRKLDLKRDVRIQFGEYVQVHEDDIIKNTLKERTVDAIAVRMKGNVQGTAEFLSLTTWRVISRDRWTSLPMPQSVIEKINAKALMEKKQGLSALNFQFGNGNVIGDDDERNGVEDDPDELVFRQQPMDLREIPYHVDDTNEDEVRDLSDRAAAEAIFEPVADDTNNDDQPVYSDDGLLPAAISIPPSEDVIYREDAPDRGADRRGAEDAPDRGADRRGAEDEVDLGNDGRGADGDGGSTNDHRYNFRPRTAKVTEGRWEERYGFNLQFETVQTQVKRLGVNGIKSILKELRQLVAKRVWTGLKPCSLNKSQLKKVIRSRMFLKVKNDGSVKGRLVAGGHMQDKSIYEDLSSPTVATQSIFMIAAIAQQEHRFVRTLDIEGAYLNADMGDNEVIMKVDPYLSDYLVDMYPEDYKGLKNDKGEIFVKLKKALYGCVESARLFYLHVKNTLNDFGFVENPYDHCVFNKMSDDGVQCTIAVHVDDLFITSKSDIMIDELVAHLKDVYKKVKVTEGKEHLYLGMLFKFQDTFVEIDMKKYIQEMLDEYNVFGTVTSPATNGLFDINESEIRLTKVEMEKFHTITAKLLYLSKRGRPDILTAVSFLTTRVLNSTVEDNRKLERVLKYLNGSNHIVLRLSGSQGLSIEAFVDSSFGVHPKAQSHTGGAIRIGGGMVHAKSSRQKLISKSSTEAELVGLSDYIPQVI